MSKHTLEPWSVACGEGHHEGWVVITAKHAGMTAETPLAKISDVCGDAMPDAARIVACVNACAGMDDPAAEIATLREHAQNVDQYAERFHAQCNALQAERNALKDALALVLPMAKGYAHLNRVGRNAEFIERANAVLAGQS